jgi:amino acid adenylation domain-containing protein
MRYSSPSATHELTHPQKRIWYAEKLYPGTPLHNLAGTATYRAALDFALLERAFHRLVEHHDATRLRVREIPGVGVRQWVADFEPFQVPIVDLSSHPDPRAAFERWRAEEARRIFELEGGPLFRVKLFRISATECGYFVNFHHLISDGWSIQLLADFVSRAYGDEEHGRAAPTPPAPSYLELLAEEEGYATSGRLERSRRYWLEALQDAPRYRADAAGTVGEQVRYRVPAAHADALRAYAARAGVSVATVFTALLALYLWKREAAEDLVIGLPLANRTGRRKNAFGMFASTMPLRLRLRADESFDALVAQVHGALRVAFRHQRYPLDLLLRDPRVGGGGGEALFQACVNYYNTRTEAVARIGDHAAEVEECYVGHQLFPLYVVIREWSADGRIEIHVNHKPSLYPTREVERLAPALIDAFLAVEAAPETALVRSPIALQRSGRDEPRSREAEAMTIAGRKRDEAVDVACFPTTRPDASRRPRGERSLRDVERATFDVPTSVLERLGDRFGREAGAMDAVWVAAVAVVLSRHLARTEVELGVAGAAGDARPRRLPCQAAPGASFADLVAAARRALASSPHASPHAPISGDGVGVIVELGQSSEPATAPVSIAIGGAADRVVGCIRYDATMYDRAGMDRLAASLVQTLTQAASSTASVHQWEIVGDAERDLLLDGFNATQRPLDRTTMVRLFEATAARHPDRPALHFDDDTWSYRRLDQQANRFARALRRAGVGPGSIVPILVERSPELLVAIVGVLKAGGAYLPIDPSYPRSRVDFILADSRASVVVSTSERMKSHDGCEILWVDDRRHDTEASDDLPSAAGPSDLAYVCYTSGSTGAPKGAMIEHGALVNRLQWMQRAYPLDTGDVLLQKTSISFDVSVWELLWWCLSGASLCLARPGEERLPERLVERIERYRVTVIHFVPSMLQAFLAYADRNEITDRLRSLRRVFASGEALRPDHVDAFRRAFAGRGTRLTNLYGPTEATIDVTYHDCPDADACARVPIGRPIDNTWLRVLGPEGKLQPVGAAGELFIGGVGLARGYWNRPELTEQRFVPDPYRDGERLYRTGDHARWLPDGELEFLGRKDHQVKLHGFRIELGEIEAALRRHAHVRDAAVVLLDSGQSTPQLCGYVVLTEGATVNDIRAHLMEQLPAYMVPGWIQPLPALPLGPNGKLDRGALPRPSHPGAAETPTPPEGPLEQALAAVWSEVLGRPSVGVNDNFFALGGDSILIITLLAKARARGLRFATEDVYRHPTIRGLAGVLEQGQSDTTAATEPFALLGEADRAKLPASAEDAYPLSVLQAGLIYQSQLDREAALYHDVFSYRIRGAFDAGKFAQATARLCRAHCMLRTTFHLTEFSEPIQIVHREPRDLLAVTDLQGLAPAQQEQAVERDIARMRQQRFDWEVPRLVGFHVHVLSPSEYVYTIDFHDSALDGWSVNLIHRELFDTYFALVAGEPPAETPRTVKFRDFVELERKALASEADKAFWARTLEGSTFTALPRWPHRHGVPKRAVDFHEVSLRPGLSAQLKSVAGELGVPPKCVLLAAHLRVLSVLTGTSDVITGYEYGVRPEDTDGERVVGLFLNTLPLRIDTSAGSWADLIRRAYETETSFLAHRRYPMAQMKRDRGARTMLFETVFNFTHFHVLSALKRMPGFELTEVTVRAETEFPLRAECSVHPFTDEVLVWIHYHADAFPPEQIEAIGNLYARALEAIVRDPQAAAHGPSLLSAEERRMQLDGFHTSAKPLPTDRCFHHLFEEQVRRSPDRVAATYGGESWTYGELNRAANRFAHALRRVVPTGEAIVAIAMDRDLRWMAGVIGCFKAGCAYLPLDLEHPAERIGNILSQSDCALVIAGTDAIAAQIDVARGYRSAGAPALTVLHALAVLRDEARDDDPGRDVTHDTLAYVIFTSGSTGTPKGAMIEHGGMLNHLLSKVEDLQMRSDDVLAQNASQCFDISVWQLLAAALVGARVVIYSNERIADVDGFQRALSADGVSILEVVPSYLALMMTLLERAPRSLDPLRLLLVTGEPVKAELLRRWFAAYPELPVVNAYGPTEASDDICHHVMTAAPEGAIVPVGKPIRNLHVYVLDERRELVPIGTQGEVCVSGVGVGRGYVNDPVRTREAFVDDPFFPGRRMYRTGDLGRWSVDGVLELAGRKDDQVKVRGYRIETGEIEARLLELAGIDAAAVIVDPRDAVLVAFVVGAGEPDPGALKRGLAQTLPEYMVPSRFVRLDALPLTSNGKIARRLLLERLTATRDRDADALLPLESPTEVELARLWAAALAIDPERIGRNSDFFELGGHSLKAMELALHSDGRFTINDVIKYPVLHDLARRVDHIAVSGGTGEILVELAAGRPGTTVAFVGITYAGGNAINFKPLSDALEASSRHVATYAIEIPRPRAGSPGEWSLERTARVCADEIRRRVQVPVVLWGHCSGSALALEVARLLEAAGIELAQVFLGGKVISSRPVARARSLAERVLSLFMAVDASQMSAEEIKSWLVNKTGFDGFDHLSAEDALVVTEAFRHDASGAARYFEQAQLGKRRFTLAAPVLNVVAKDDPLTEGFETKYKNWRLFAGRVELSVLDSGGHYFIKTRARETASVIRRRLEALDLLPAPSGAEPRVSMPAGSASPNSE